MTLYAQIDRANGTVLEYRDVAAMERALNKRIVWIPVVRVAKPNFNSDIERLTATVTQPDLSNLAVDVPANAERVEGWAVETISLAACKSNKKAKVDALLAQKFAAGRVYSGHTFQIRAQDLTNITGIRVALLARIANAHNGVWRSKANVDVAMDDAAFAAFSANVMAYVRDLIRHSSALKDAIEALATVAAVDNYDITLNWPVNA